MTPPLGFRTYDYIYKYMLYMGVGQGERVQTPLFVELAADFLESRFGRHMWGTILGGAHTPPPILNAGNRKTEVSLLVETVARLYSLRKVDASA